MTTDDEIYALRQACYHSGNWLGYLVHMEFEQKNFADEAVRNCNKTNSGNWDMQATSKPDLNSAARKPMQ